VFSVFGFCGIFDKRGNSLVYLLVYFLVYHICVGHNPTLFLN
jgi:hypothetical protein